MNKLVRDVAGGMEKAVYMGLSIAASQIGVVNLLIYGTYMRSFDCDNGAL